MPTKLSDAISSSKADWESEHGKCSMCNTGKPDNNGYHYCNGMALRCGNVEACTICHGCLPPGEVCRACSRKNVYEYECLHDNTSIQRGREGETMSTENAQTRLPCNAVVRQRGSVRFWCLVGHWHGMPCAIQRGGHIPCWTVWSVTDERQWHDFRRQGFYTRRSRSRPTDYVDREFQKTTKPDVFDESE